MYDSIVVGAGPAGITAAIYAIRKNMSVLVLTGDIGGQTSWSGDIENYVGYQFISGVELTGKFEEHMSHYGVEVKESEEVTALERAEEGFTLKTEKTEYNARTVIIASGKRPRELGVPGEREFRGRGVTYCATCDGPLFGGKDVAVVGGGNSSLEAVLQLIRIARQVYLINIAAELTGDAIMQEKIKGNGTVTILNNSAVKEVRGKTVVEEITVETNGALKNIAVNGVFSEIGLIPNSEFVPSEIARNKWGEVIVNNRNETNMPGVFAAGDVTDVPEKQIIIAAGEGAKAALSAFKYLALKQ